MYLVGYVTRLAPALDELEGNPATERRCFFPESQS